MEDDAPAIVPDFTWDTFVASRADHSGSDLSLNDNAIPGLSAATREEREMIRVALAQLMWLTTFLIKAHVHLGKPGFKIACSGARLLLGRSQTHVPGAPFGDLTRKRTQTEFDNSFSAENPNKCLTRWGPRPGLIADILGPITMMVIVWLGDDFAMPVLDLAFAFATDYKSFTVAWLECPAVTESLDLLAVQSRASKLRNSPLINSPGAAVIHLAGQMKSTLDEVVHAIYHSFSARKICQDAFQRVLEPMDITDAFKSDAKQYLNCTITVANKVQSILPTKSSLPDITPNFTDDGATTWYRGAEYAFSSIKMPTAAALRGDSLAELRWHKYQSDVLHARANVPQLSERQVIQHLSSTFSRSDQHFTIAQEAMLMPDCTVRHWLDVIKDFYFTSGQFRLNIEDAWKQYTASTAQDFNDLIHYIKTYYRLIFLDYVHMRGVQRKIDFAWILHNKLRHVLHPTQSSRVCETLRNWMSYSELLDKMKRDLKPALNEIDTVSDRVAESFIEWVIEQLQDVRETANTARFYDADNMHSEAQVDFALTHAPRKQQDRARSHKPTLQAAAAAAQEPYAKRHGALQRQSRGSGQKKIMIPLLKDMANTLDPTAFVHWAKGFIQNPDINEDIRQSIRLEINGGPTSLHGALSSATGALPNGLQATLMHVCQAILKMFYLFPFKQCIFCPDSRQLQSSQSAVPCKLCNCKVFNALLPDAARIAFFEDPFNKTRQGAPSPPGHVNASAPSGRRQDFKRSRYESERKGPGTQQPKRSRASHQTQQIR